MLKYTASVMPLSELGGRAEKVMEIKKIWDDTFNGNYDDHLKMVIMAVIFDAYNDGYKKGQES